jgi:alpha-mannosidase
VRGAEHPTEQLGAFWRLLLLNQFHDVLPGSSITQVYDEAAQDHVAVLEGADGIVGAALHVLAGDGDGPTPVNTIGFARSEVAERPGGGPEWVEAASYGYGAIGDAPAGVTLTEAGDRIVLENHRLRVELGRDGAVHSLVERSTGREALAGPGNVLQVFDDRPTMWDAWDVDPFHLETAKDCPPAESCSVVAGGRLRAEVVFERRIGRGSTMRQRIRLDAGSGRLEFHCDVDWHERNTFLKVLFPVGVHSPNATYQMQFGHTERPTHFSTSHDLARFEVPGHRFADLSEHGFGVALLTDCKYGYSTLGNEMRISLLRGTTQPDPDADQGRHAFAYAVMPHAGGWREAGVVAEAARFETPLRWAPGAVEARSFFAVDDPNLVLDTVKRAEDSDALVLRLYEAHGGRGVARLRIGVPFGDAVLCNLLEDPGGPLVSSGGEIEVPYRPHEVVSVMLSPS